jgi:hypothetical protein
MCVSGRIDCEYIEEPIERGVSRDCPDTSTDAVLEGQRIGSIVSSGPTESLNSKHDGSSVAVTEDVSDVDKGDQSVGDATSNVLLAVPENEEASAEESKEERADKKMPNEEAETSDMSAQGVAK